MTQTCPDLAKMALKMLIPFATTYVCEAAFFAPLHVKKKRNRMHATHDMRVGFPKPNPKFIYFFYLYIYPPDLQKSDGGAIHWASTYPHLLPKMPRYYCPLKSFYFF